MAVLIEGTFCGVEKREFVRKADNQRITVFYHLLCEGAEFYKISSDKDYSEGLTFGDHVRFVVRPNVYKDSIYWNGKLEE